MSSNLSYDRLVEDIRLQSPRIVYLSGKTCTGKTTFAGYLEQHGYKKIELDNIVTQSVVIPFNVLPGDGFRTAYRGDGPTEQTAAFIDAARTEILKQLKVSPLVIEGAIAHSRILKELFTGELQNFVFVYFHPVNSDVYSERILSRFVAGASTNTTGLPKDFWTRVQQEDLSSFIETGEVHDGIRGAVDAYAKKSMEESGRRLEHLREAFPDLIMVEI